MRYLLFKRRHGAAVRKLCFEAWYEKFGESYLFGLEARQRRLTYILQHMKETNDKETATHRLR